MNKIKLTEYQLKELKRRISVTYDEIYDHILDEYGVMMLEDLNHSDFDAIMEDIDEWHREITASLV